MELFKSFFGRIYKDLRQKKLMPIKLIFFVKASTMFVLYPYLTIHMKELGITIEETAVMNSIIPFISVIMPPVAGLFADRIGNFKIMLALFSAVGGAAALLLLLVPVARTNVEYPNSLVLATDGCGPGADFIYGAYQNFPCDAISDAKTELTLESCGYTCPLGSLNESYVKDILASRNYKLHVHNAETHSDTSYSYAISESDMPEKSIILLDPRETRKLENIEYYEIAIRRLSSGTLFFPAHKPPLFNFECDAGYNSSVCAFRSEGNEVEPVKLKTSLKAIKPTDVDEAEERHRYVAEGIECALGSEEETESVGVEVDLVDEVVKLCDCNRSCVFTAPRKDVCSNMKFVVEYDTKLTFWSYLAVRVFIGVISSTTFPMFEGAVIAILRERKADYGLQRIYGSLGVIIAAPLSGLLTDYVSRGKGFADLRPSFYLYAGLKISTSFLIFLVDLDFKTPNSKVTREVMAVLKNIEILALLIASSVLGIAWGFIESFLFWFLEDLGAPRSLMGMTFTIHCVGGLPLLVLAGLIIDKIGHANVIATGFICYSIRLLGYSYLYDPQLCLLLEVLESFTSALIPTATVTYAAKLSTTTTDSTVQGLLGGLHYAVGKGGGSLVGGYMLKVFGVRPTYRIFSAATLATGAMYFCFNKFYLLRRQQAENTDVEVKYKKKEIIEGEPKAVDDIEAINNAKNLHNIEQVLSADVEKNEKHSGTDNAAFDGDEEARKDKKIIGHF